MYTSERSDGTYNPYYPRDVTKPSGEFLVGNLVDYPRLNGVYNKLYGLIGHPFWIAGGALTSLLSGDKINDWDVFTDNWKLVKSALDKSCTLSWENTHVANYTHKDFDQVIQLVKRDMTSPLDCVENIDLTICAGAFDGQNLIMHSDMFEDIENNNLTLNVVHWPLSTLNRIIKYAQRGYKPSGDTLVTLVDLIRNADIQDLNSLSFYIENEQS